VSDAVVWHDVECGSYTADLPLWRELAGRLGGPVLDLGAGTGRVALDLAACGHEVTAVDLEAELLDDLGRRAASRALDVERIHADARELAVPERYGLVLAPMQLIQIVGGRAGRAALLQGAATSLRPGGHFAAALSELDEALPPDDALPPMPDIGEHDGFVYSSLPTDVRPQGGGVAVERLRQVVSPGGELTETRHTQLLDALAVDALEREAAAQGLEPVERHEIAPTADHVGSMVVVCRR